MRPGAGRAATGRRIPRVLTPRQETVLGLVVENYLETGRPVGSKALASSTLLRCSASTVRAELAALEEKGYLSHPHTSAGRVPTDRGYRHYVESIVPEAGSGHSQRSELDLTRLRAEADAAMREATAALSRMTDLLALVVAPPVGTATIHRVEALLLRPDTVMVVVISSSGDVTKRSFTFPRELDPGLVEWASAYLNEVLVGTDVGARRIASLITDPSLGPAESEFLEALAPAVFEFGRVDEPELYMEGAGRLLESGRAAELPEVDRLMTALEQRAAVLGMMRSAIDERSVFLWIGGENPRPELRSVSVVGANYGLPHRNLGSVGVVGPTRMDYETAITAVREASRELSRYFEYLYR